MTIHPYNTRSLGWRIATITFTAPPGLPGLRQSTINTIRTSDTSGPWVGWSFEVDGPSLLMISPTGWQAGKAERVGDKVTVYEVSKALAAIAWEYEPAADSFTMGPVIVVGDKITASDQVVTAVDAATGTITLAQVAANEATIAAAVAAFASPLPAAAPVERDEPPDEPIVPVKRGPGRPRKNP